jgi:5-oxoprolinase (ATP-hydrolysing) subunit A
MTAIPTIDFNADLGEDCGDDAGVIPWISSASIACGGHAGDARTMAATVRLCREHGVAIGAHPSYPDRAGFGRQAIDMPLDALLQSIREQVEALAEVAARAGTRLAHVKPHGALYNRSAVDPGLAAAIAEAVCAIDPGLRLFGLAGSASLTAAQAAGLAAVAEAFADRRYRPGGTLVPRSEAHAVIDDPALAAEQVLSLLRAGRVTADDGSTLELQADTICLHGDRPDAADFAARLHRAIRAAGYRITAPGACR